jgi:hypothetical protein
VNRQVTVHYDVALISASDPALPPANAQASSSVIG